MPKIFKNSYFIAALLFGLVVVFMLTGSLVIGGRGPGEGETSVARELGLVKPETTETAKTEQVGDGAKTDIEAQLVQTSWFDAQQMSDVISVRGVSQANSKVAVRTETTALLSNRHVQKGQSVQRGDLLCTLDQGTRNVRLLQAEASLEQARADYEAAKTLSERGFSSKNNVKALQAAFKAAEAARDDAKTELARTEVKAPIDGIVQDPVAEVGDMLATGSTCVTLVNLDPIKFSGQVSEQSIAKVKPGLLARANFVTGEEVQGAVSFVATSADAQTRSFPVEIELPNPNQSLRDGVTTTAHILVAEQKAHLLAQSLLVLSDEGEIGVRIVKDDKALFSPVQILRETPEGVWVAGLDDKVQVITVGQQYVIHGSPVRIAPEASETADATDNSANETDGETAS